jgi:uncharacterized protein (DUF3820 family)
MYYLNTKLKFGKYKGLRMENVIDNDIEYFYWLLENKIININANIKNYLTATPFK